MGRQPRFSARIVPACVAMPEPIRSANRISLSTAPAVQALGKKYYDLSGTLELMDRLRAASVVDGFEFQILEEWDAAHPPREQAEYRLSAWNDSPKYPLEQIVALLREGTYPVLSLHAYRDIGIYLCSDQEADIHRGKALLHQSLSLAQEIGAQVCVFHLWDTWKTNLNPIWLYDVLLATASCYPSVKAAVENVPTQLPGSTPFQLVRQFPWITLDLQWAAMYDELAQFESLKDRIVNVHLRGRLADGRWVLQDAPFDFYGALDIIRNQWGYTGPLTMEPSGLRQGDWHNLVAAMLSLRR